MHGMKTEVAARVGNLRRLTRRRSTGVQAARNVPARAPDGVKPIFEKAVDGSLDAIRAAFLRLENCPMVRFLEEYMECYDIEATEWKPDDTVAGTLVRKCHYAAPVPADVPDSVAKLVGLPPVVGTTTVYRLRTVDPGEVTLVQQSYTGDVMYGDRFKIQHTISFKEEAGGMIVSRQWTQIVWEQPLPWTHSMIRHFIEKRTKSESSRSAPQLLRMIEDAVLALDVDVET